MGEIAALGSAFDSEFAKATASLPLIRNSPTAHDAHLLHHRQSQRVIECVAYYGSKLPPYASAERILSFAESLVKRQEHGLASDACYKFVRALGLPDQSDVQRMDAQASRRSASNHDSIHPHTFIPSWTSLRSETFSFSVCRLACRTMLRHAWGSRHARRRFCLGTMLASSTRTRLRVS
jgi:hypothetical protein